jgi:hypothetical protein
MRVEKINFGGEKILLLCAMGLYRMIKIPVEYEAFRITLFARP